MKILAKAGDENIAMVYIAQLDNERFIEFVESVQPPLPREDKWVLIISTLYGCPVGCRFCDAGNFYQGKLSTGELLSQIDYMVARRFPDKNIPVKKFKKNSPNKRGRFTSPQLFHPQEVTTRHFPLISRFRVSIKPANGK